ncbi:hypothetical protein GF336_00005 [Candidatus Woesearchaeota archaeon]|nr:hypothetical protein [Candidatus Woesearchaeota archaeon]
MVEIKTLFELSRWLGRFSFGGYEISLIAVGIIVSSLNIEPFIIAIVSLLSFPLVSLLFTLSVFVIANRIDYKISFEDYTGLILACGGILTASSALFSLLYNGAIYDMIRSKPLTVIVVMVTLNIIIESIIYRRIKMLRRDRSSY